MALKKWAYIFMSAGFKYSDPPTIVSSKECDFRLIGLAFSEKHLVIEVARTLVSDGVQLSELCGGFGPLWMAKVVEATDGKVPVGTVVYGPEARQLILDILSQ